MTSWRTACRPLHWLPDMTARKATDKARKGTDALAGASKRKRKPAAKAAPRYEDLPGLDQWNGHSAWNDRQYAEHNKQHADLCEKYIPIIADRLHISRHTVDANRMESKARGWISGITLASVVTGIIWIIRTFVVS